MLLPIEVEMSDNARAVATAAQVLVEGEQAAAVKRQAEGEFLRRLVAQLEPMLRESMRSRNIFLASDPYGVVALKSDGIFVHVGFADQEDALEPVQVLDAEPKLLTILDRIEAELIVADDARATSAADIVRLARYSLQVATAT